MPYNALFGSVPGLVLPTWATEVLGCWGFECPVKVVAF